MAEKSHFVFNSHAHNPAKSCILFSADKTLQHMYVCTYVHMYVGLLQIRIRQLAADKDSGYPMDSF